MNICQAAVKSVWPVKAGHKKPRLWHLTAGWLVMVLYLLDYSPAGACVTAFVGSFDSNHEVRFQFNGGSLQVVLHHGHGCIGHHHGLVARTLTLFAQPATSANPDHCIQFGAGDNFSSQKQITQSKLTPSALPSAALREIAFTIPNPAWAASMAPRPPPDDGGHLVCLRSTVFLI